MVFAEDFSRYADGEHPGTIEVVRHSIHPHLHGHVLNHTYAILNGANRHLPRVPPLDDFVLEFRARADTSTEVAILVIPFRFNPRDRTGYIIFYRWGKKFGPRCSLHAQEQWSGLPANKVKVRDTKQETGAWQSFRLVVEGQHFRFYHGEMLQGDWHETEERHTEPGRIGFDIVGSNATVPGPIYIDDVVIRVPEPGEEAFEMTKKEAEK